MWHQKTSEATYQIQRDKNQGRQMRDLPAYHLGKSKASKSMEVKVINTVNSFLHFLYGKNKYLTPTLARLLCNTLTQYTTTHSYNTPYCDCTWTCSVQI